MSHRKITEDTIVYVSDLEGTIELLAKDLAEIQRRLGIWDGSGKLSDPEPKREMFEAAFEQHVRCIRLKNSPDTTASVKMMITKVDEAELSKLGYSPEQIGKMKPAEVCDILQKSKSAAAGE